MLMVNAGSGAFCSSPVLHRNAGVAGRQGKRQVDRRGFCITSAFVASIFLSACVANTPTPSTDTPASSQPVRSMAFRCDGNVQVSIGDTGDTVHVTDSRGVDVQLPASPPAQRSRYSQPGYALVLEGRKALWMVSGKRPVNCVM